MFRFKFALMGALVIGVASLTSCQTAGEKSTKTSVICPSCKTETTTTPLKGLSFTKHMCPKCRSTSNVSGESWDPIHVCNSCEQVVEKCSLCEKESGN